jgi:uncharacterized membrane protein
MEKLEMSSSRLEAFSDGVIAIIITIMVLELKVPHTSNPKDLLALWPVFISYALSFLMVSVYWVNHHHMFHLFKRVDSRILWTNIFLLFCISLIPFFTAYMNENHMNNFSVALYSGILLICACAYRILGLAIAHQFKDDDKFKLIDKASSHKNWIAVALYVLAIFFAYTHSAISLTLNFIVAVMYFVPGFYLERKHT